MTKDIVLNPLEFFLLGKHHIVSFPSFARRISELLSLVHSNVCGPIEVKSLDGNRYFVTFIDDTSRKMWVYFLISKDHVLEYFRIFHAMLERETGKKLKCLRTDNGGSVVPRSLRLVAYCAEHGIRHKKTVPLTPQQNGVAERMNRTTVERVR